VSKQDDLYEDAAGTYGAALNRLARGYEPHPEQRRDLLQDIHTALWQSLDRFDGRCSLRTWTYRVANNIAISKVLRRRGKTPTLVSLDQLDAPADSADREHQFDRARALERLLVLIHELIPIDRQVMLLYLEDLDAAEIGDITGVSSANVATKVHRIKKLLAARFQRFYQGECDGD
jgi:RNA polymerase sigma-70 factor (ECF subfamily)